MTGDIMREGVKTERLEKSLCKNTIFGLKEAILIQRSIRCKMREFRYQVINSKEVLYSDGAQQHLWLISPNKMDTLLDAGGMV